MAATVEGTFRLIDKASGVLDKIEARANKVNLALQGAGKALDDFGDKTDKVKVKVNLLNETLNKLGRNKATPRIDLQGAGTALAEIKAVDAAMDSVDRKAKARGGRGGVIGKFFGALPTGGNSNLESIFGSMEGRVTRLTQRLRPLGSVVGGVVGGLGGMLTAFGALPALIAAGLPLILALTGALTALVGVLSFAVGGAAVVGAGLLGAFAVGFGSIFAIVKDSLGPLKQYNKAVTALNKAMASGSPARILAAQNAVNTIAKAHPGVAKTAMALKAIKTEFEQITKPERSKFFAFLGSTLASIAKSLKGFGGDIRRNFEAGLGAADHLVKMFTGPAWKSIIHSLSGIFQKSIGPITTGIERFMRGIGRLVQMARPQIEGLAKGFSKLGLKFLEWAESKRGRKALNAMLASLKSVGRLLGSTARLLGALFGASAPSGRGLVDSLTKTFDKWTKWLQDPKHQKTIHKFFQDSIDLTKTLASTLASVAGSLFDIGKRLMPIANFLLKHPDLLLALGGGFVASKGITGLAKGVKGGKGLFDTLLGKGGPSGTARDPIYVRTEGSGPSRKGKPGGPVAEPGGGGGAGGKEDPGTRITRGFGRLATRAPIRTAGGIATALVGFAGMHGAAGGVGNQLNAGAHAIDPTNVLHLVGLPSLSDLLPAYRRRIKVTPRNIQSALLGATPIGTPGSPQRNAAISGLPTNPRASGILSAGSPHGNSMAAIANALNQGLMPGSRNVQKDAKDTTKAVQDFHDNSTKATGAVAKAATTDLGAFSKAFTDNITKVKGSVFTDLPAILTEMTVDLKKINSGSTIPAGNPNIPVNKKARGGRIMGVGLQDTVPIANNTLAAPGELVVNRHTERRANAMLLQHGMTLGGMVGTETTRHSKRAALGRRVDSGATKGGTGGLHPGIANAVQAVLGHFPGLMVTSTTGGTHAPGSYHYLGEAADIAGAPALMNQAASWIKSTMGSNLTEGIHNPNLSVKFGKNVPSSFWGSSTWAAHANHIHLAVAGVLGALSGLGGGGAVPRLHARHVAGSGLAQQVGQGAVNQVRGSAQARLRAVVAALGGGDMSGGGLTSAGGQFNKKALEQLWTGAGGPANLANIAAAIALAESHGDPHAHNPSGATGLWQILGSVVPGNLYNPHVNAANAVKKYRDAGGWSPWVTYTSGAYKQYLGMGGRVPNGLPFGGWFGDGGSITAHKPTYIGIGDGGTETATITKGATGRKAAFHIENLHVHGGDDTKREVMAAFRDLARELDLQGPEDGQ